MTATDVRVWAPKPENVEVVVADRRHPMTPAGDGWWAARVELQDGDRYGFSLDGGPTRLDPRGRRLPEGPHGPSAYFDVSRHSWTDAGWTGVELEGAVVYELHVGTFTPEGTLDAAVERLDHLVDLGVTLVEVMPVAPFPGRHGWGYDGVSPYAVHEAYGGPAALQRFVDAAHSRRLGVCLDVVYNHLGPDGNYLPEFGPYLTDRYATPWGAALNLDGAESDEVRSWMCDNAIQWFRDFHLDALRLDAVHELIDNRAVHVLEELSTRTDALAHALGRKLWLIAESDRNDSRTVLERGRGGMGVHAQWADDVHHALHVALTGERQGYYADFADPAALPKALRSPFFHDGQWSSFRKRSHGRPVDLDATPPYRFVASLQTHDQVGNRAEGERLSSLVDHGRLAAGAAILLTAPWTPMLFMGEEWGATTPWQFFTDHTDPAIAEATRSGRRAEFAGHGWSENVPDPQDPDTFARSQLDWAETEKENHRRLLDWYRNLIALRLDYPVLREGTGQVSYDHERATLTVRAAPLTVLVNLSDEQRSFRPRGRVILTWQPGLGVEGDRIDVPGPSAVVLSD